MKTVRIGVSQWVPWIKFDANKSLESAEGVLVEFYKGMKHAKVFDYQLQVESVYGILGPDKKWTGMIGAMLRNETDIVGPFFMDERRGSVVQFVSPLDFSQLVLVTGLTHASNYPFLIFKVFSIEVYHFQYQLPDFLSKFAPLDIPKEMEEISD
ncbi:uncharacterized protein LOC129980750 [Argiope bruennichi]|uniref:uncharacterized protein LOC129980750 n=1 Tax=Argiope bruennichi TaxID=94029 RepID=UPI00249597C7|nr:uncharacterized protein LOC129980750 [Argiope bruennichi]